MLPPVTETTAVVGATPLTVAGGTMNAPGFLRLVATAEIDGRTYRGVGTAGFAPERIQPTQMNPPDFDSFWEAERARLAALPIDAKWTPLPDYGTADVDCSQINLQNVGLTAGTSRLYGILCMPRAPGKYPAMLSVPGAGVRPYRGLPEIAARGLITFQIGIHGIPVIQPQEVYDSLASGGLSGYPTFGLDSRERYYYRRVYTGTLRANDFLTSLPQWDGRNLGVTGGSQGGALAIVTAGLDRRVTRLAAYYPALSDVTGYLTQRAGGWPHMFRATDGPGAASRRGEDHDDAVLRRRQFRAPRHRAGPLLVGLQRRDVSADVDLLRLQRDHRAEAPDPRLRHRPSLDAGAGRRRGRLAGRRAHGTELATGRAIGSGHCAEQHSPAARPAIFRCMLPNPSATPSSLEVSKIARRYGRRVAMLTTAPPTASSSSWPLCSSCLWLSWTACGCSNETGRNSKDVRMSFAPLASGPMSRATPSSSRAESCLLRFT